jgi:hypothetical protein
MVVMRIRDATGLAVAVACGALAACADASGIVLTVAPSAERPELVEADSLVVYVGYDDVVESPLGQTEIHLHYDDGAARELELAAPFDAPIEVLLDGPETGRAFYVAIRAEVDGQVIGEGGVDGALTLVEGRVTTAVAEVGGPLSRSMPNCPGFRMDNVRHHVVSTGRDDDCDADGELAIEANGPDCNDFDATFHTGADDQVCDDFDHSCGDNTSITQSPCLVESGGNCTVGAQTCRDGEGGTSACIPDPSNVVPHQVCEVCGDAMNQSDLEECLPNAEIAYSGVCNLKRVGRDFCLPKALELMYAPDVWLQDHQVIALDHPVRWLDVPVVPEYDFVWAVGPPPTLLSASPHYPGSPALKLVSDPGVIVHQFTKYVGAINPAGEAELWEVHFRIEDGDLCPADEEPDCFDIPGALPK